MQRTKVLVVDDEAAIIRFLSANLQANGFQTFAAVDGAEAIRTIERELPDLVIMDIVMPEINGIEVCRQLRQWSEIPIIMLSAQGSADDGVKCLDLGADDYVAKPFRIEELLARMRAVLRRTAASRVTLTEPCFTCDHLQINFAERRVTFAGQEVRLTPTEYNLLKELVLNANKVLTHKMLLNKVWGPEYGDEREYLRTFVGRLRRLLEPEPEKPRHILTIPAVGYQFRTELQF